MKTRSVLGLALGVFALWHGLATVPQQGRVSAADWPQWRGPDRTDVSKETGLLKTWPKEGPKLLWTYADAGVGFSGPAIVGERLFTLGGRGDSEYVFALNTKTGKQEWATAIGPLFENGYGDGPRSTPTVDGDLLYVLGGQGNLVCVETTTGKKRWQVSMQTDLKGEMMSGWGYSESPLVDGDQVVCSPGGDEGTLAALDKKTGKVLWRSKDLKDKATYSSIVVAEIGGVRQYVQLTHLRGNDGGIVGVAAKDGKLLWYYKRPGYQTAVVPTPIVHGDLVYATAGYAAGCDLLQIEAKGGAFKAEQLYKKKERRNMQNMHGGVLLVGDYVYGHSERHGLACQQLKTGEIAWEEENQVGKGSLTCADGRLYYFGERDGKVSLVQANPQSFTLDGQFEIPRQTNKTRKEGLIWTHPVVANGCLYLRDQELIFCYDVREKRAGGR
jgi:outer membrane protein assembly factor BamB